MGCGCCCANQIVQKKFGISQVQQYFENDDHKRLQMLGTKYMAQSNFKAALNCYQQIEKISPNDFINLNNIAVAYSCLQNYELSILYNEKAIKADPSHFTPYMNLALQYYERGNDKKKSLSYAHRANQINSKNFQCHRLLGLIHESNDQYKKAIKEYQIAVNLNPNDLEIYQHLVAAQIFVGDRQNALNNIKRVKQLDNGSQLTKVLIEKLDLIFFCLNFVFFYILQKEYHTVSTNKIPVHNKKNHANQVQDVQKPQQKKYKFINNQKLNLCMIIGQASKRIVVIERRISEDTQIGNEGEYTIDGQLQCIDIEKSLLCVAKSTVPLPPLTSSSVKH